MKLKSLAAGIVLCSTFAAPSFANDDDWPQASPEETGLSTAALDQAAAQVEQVKLRYCMSVVKDGKLIYDTNFRGESNDSYFTFSVTKTLGAVLIGIAEYQGYLSLDDRIAHWLGKTPYGMNKEATIRDVLGQVSHSDPLGSDFKYNSGSLINTLGEVLSIATGMRSKDYAQQALFDPLGMQYSRWNSDWWGNISIGAGVSSSCRDLARIGLLMMDGGSWQGQRLLAESYVEEMINPSYPEANSNYGYLTWLNQSDGEWHRIFDSGTDIMVKNAPRNAYFATGFFGQLIINVPDENLVVTTIGTTFEAETLHTLQDVWDAIAPAILPPAAQ